MKYLRSLIILFISGCATSVPVILDGSRSYDPDGYIVKYRWDQVNGNKARIENADRSKALVVLKKGSYKFRLSGVDNDGDSSSTIKQIIIK